MVLNSKFSVKGVKTFLGRDGHGVNAKLFFENKKIGQLIDSGNGGAMDILYNSEGISREHKDMKILIASLPKCTFGEYSDEESSGGSKSWFSLGDSEYLWNDESICNILIDDILDLKEFKKNLKNVVVLTKDGTLFKYKSKAVELDKLITHNGNDIPLRSYIKMTNMSCIILNDLSVNEARKLYNKSVGA